MKEVPTHIIKDLRSTIGGGEGAKLYVVTTVSDCTTEVVVEKNISERFPIQELEKATDLFERLTCGGGRKCWSLEELAHPYNPE